MRRTLRIAGILLVLLVILFMGPRVHEGYQTRKRVAEIVRLAEGVRDRVEQFYRIQKRLPNAQEAGGFRVEGDGYFKSIAFDAEGKMVVVTMPVRDEQFAIRATEGGASLSWTCRTINYRESDLPRTCR